ncbi:enoyl-CoA hydratase [Paenirhodobacter enshiensis]|uniref:3-hydroxyisobutyryl-CoA hydrolase n=2 Tax=Paenirhodobacter enshiensis TaxID=1105367 RepID=A0A086XWY3_9RHOB|nr:enoyl-CoA hydratase [Paenirhodobacter enshiensis]
MTETMIARKEGRAGRLTLNRPKALNALDHEMAQTLEAALDAWRDDPEVDLILIDAEGSRAFCAGGDIAAVYHAGKAGDFAAGGAYWRDEYRMNAKIKEYPKPVIAFMQGFVMGGGVGLGGHGSHRVIGETTQVAMPETGIGLVPDVGGSLVLALSPGRIGEYLGVTGSRINAADAIYAGFADLFIPEANWPALKAKLAETGDPGVLPTGLMPPEPGRLAALRPEIDAAFSGADVREIVERLRAMDSDFARETLDVILQKSALSEQATLRLVRMTRATPTIRDALSNEFRFTLRAAEHSDFLEGVRAQIIDKDRTPRWRWSLATLPPDLVDAMLAPVPAEWRIDFA